MLSYDRTKPLIAIHIPKSAGTSAKVFFRGWFGQGFRQHYFNEEKGRMPKKYDLAAMHTLECPVVVYGHFNRLRHFGIEDYYPEVQQFVTILRDPLELVMSSYFFTRRVGEGWRDKSRVPTGALSEYLLDSRPNMLNHFPRQVTASNYREIVEKYFIHIGTTENLQESLRSIAAKLGMAFDDDLLEHLNPTSRDETASPNVRDLFVEKFKLEYDVYNYAIEYFSQPGREQGEK